MGENLIYTCTLRIAKESVHTLFTSLSFVLQFAFALSCYSIASKIFAVAWMTFTRCTFREVIISWSTFITEFSSVVFLTRTLSFSFTYTNWNTVRTLPCSSREAVAGFTFWIVVVPFSTCRTVFSSSERFLALTCSAFSSTAPSVSWICIALAGYTRLSIVWENTDRPVVSVDAGVAVDTGGEVPALLAHSAALVVPVDVHRHSHIRNGLIIVALLAVSIAVTRLTLESVVFGVSSPIFLCKTRCTFIAVQSNCIVKTFTL